MLANQNKIGEGYVAFIALYEAYLDCRQKQEDDAHKGKRMTNVGRVICPRTSNAEIRYGIVSEVFF